MLERHLGYLEGAHELLGVDGDARGGHDLLAVLAPRDAYGHVSGRHHAGDVHQFTDGSRGEVKRLDQRGNWGEKKTEVRDGKAHEARCARSKEKRSRGELTGR